MNVGGPAAHGVGEEAVDQAHDGSLLHLGLKLHRGVNFLFFLHEFHVLLLELLEQISEPVVRDLVIPVDRHAQRVLAGHHGVHVEPGDELQIVDDAQVRGIDHGHGKRATDTAKREKQMLAGKVGRHELEYLLVDLHLGQVHCGNAILPRKEPRQLRLGNRAARNQRKADSGPSLLLLLEGLIQLLPRDQTLTQEHLADLGLFQ